MRFGVAVALIAAVVVLCVIAATPGGAPVQPVAHRVDAAVADCSLRDLAVRLGAGAGAGMSQLRVTLHLRNRTSHRCLLARRPRLQWADGARAVGEPARWSGRFHRFVLAPGRGASAALDEVEGDGGLSPARCDPRHVTGLRLTLPGSRGVADLPGDPQDPQGACTRLLHGSGLGLGPLRRVR